MTAAPLPLFPDPKDTPMSQNPAPVASDKQIGRSVRAAREAADITQVELSARMEARGVETHNSLLSQTELGRRRLYFTEALAIADSLGIDIAALTDWERMEVERELAELRERLAAAEERLAATRAAS